MPSQSASTSTDLQRQEIEVVPENDNSEDEGSLTQEIKAPFLGFGICMGIVSGLFYASSTTMVKSLSTGGIQTAGFRCAIQYILILPFINYKTYKKKMSISGPPTKFKYLILRGFIGALAAIFLYQSIDKISVGDAVTITFTNCIFVAIFGYLFLGEVITFWDLIFFLIAISGVILISKPPILFGGETYDSDKLIGIMYAVASSACQGITFVIIRKLGKETHPLLSVFYYSVIGFVLTFCYLAYPGNFELPCVLELIIVPFIGLFGVLQQSCVTIALQYENTSTIALIRSFQIVMTFILQIIILGDIPTLFSLVGALLVFICVFGISARKLIIHLRKNK